MCEMKYSADMRLNEERVQSKSIGHWSSRSESDVGQSWYVILKNHDMLHSLEHALIHRGPQSKLEGGIIFHMMVQRVEIINRLIIVDKALYNVDK